MALTKVYFVDGGQGMVQAGHRDVAQVVQGKDRAELLLSKLNVPGGPVWRMEKVSGGYVFSTQVQDHQIKKVSPQHN